MAIIPFHIVDAFAAYPFTGNPAAIIPNAASLTDQEMQLIADELTMEAGFILPPTASRADVRLRVFTQRREAPLSGHVVIAAFASMADRGFYRPSPEGTALTVETGAGLLPVVMTPGASGLAKITVGLPGPRFGEPVPGAEVAAALGIPPAAVGIEGHGPARISCGFDQLVVPIGDRDVMRGVFDNPAAIGDLTDDLGVGGVTLVCLDTVSGDSDMACRFFNPRVGADEDVASGTSLGAAAVWLVAADLVPKRDEVRIVSEQGHSRGRPTRAELRVHCRGQLVTGVEVAASGVVVMRGSFHFNRREAVV